ncbi:sugar phosphate isomerase/epimerase family protein [Chthonobacter albigriseus]|uniref:sugar phosphate isomerase/epimerase family protein n=1 Tax=Chthonobacter albigriseus TaxID=1683161 RepID=UPI0015EF0754|nr:sugar phosphate isomerase/epimerase [Chthonobacter albigriseus]
MALEHTLSYQLYTSRNFPPLEAQLKTLARLGYTNVEPFSAVYGDVPALKAALDANGLSCVSGHFALDLMEKDLDAAVAIARTLGISIMVAPWLPPEQRPTDAAGWIALGERLGAVADKLKPLGFTLAWHNHDFEFVALPDGSMPIRHVLAHPSVMLELDVAWVARAGADPQQWLREYADRIVSVHVKDIAPAGQNADEDGWADVGDGVVPWAALWADVVKTAARITVAEHDNPSDYERFAARSAAAIKSFKG